MGGKVIPASFLKVERGGCSFGQKTGKEKRIKELVSDWNLGFEAPPRSKRG